MTDDWSSEETDDPLVADVPRSGATPAFGTPAAAATAPLNTRHACSAADARGWYRL